MLGIRLPIVISLCVLVAGCSKQEAGSVPVEAASGPEAVARLTQTLNERVASADRFLKEVGTQMDETLTRQHAKLKGARVDRRLPMGQIDGPAARDVLTAYSKMHGLGDVQLRLGKADVGPEVPGTHTGTEPYAYETKQLIGTAPIAITVASTDTKRLQTFFEAVKKLQLPFMLLPTLLVGEGKATFSGSAYFRRNVTLTVAGQPTLTLKDLAASEGAALPTDPEQLKNLMSLRAQLASRDAQMLATRRKQDEVARQARILQFMRTKAEEVTSQKPPKQVGAPPSSDTPTPPAPNKAGGATP